MLVTVFLSSQNVGGETVGGETVGDCIWECQYIVGDTTVTDSIFGGKC